MWPCSANFRLEIWRLQRKVVHSFFAKLFSLFMNEILSRCDWLVWYQDVHLIVYSQPNHFLMNFFSRKLISFTSANISVPIELSPPYVYAIQSIFASLMQGSYRLSRIFCLQNMFEFPQQHSHCKVVTLVFYSLLFLSLNIFWCH